MYIFSLCQYFKEILSISKNIYENFSVLFIIYFNIYVYVYVCTYEYIQGGTNIIRIEKFQTSISIYILNIIYHLDEIG